MVGGNEECLLLALLFVCFQMLNMHEAASATASSLHLNCVVVN